MSKHWRTEILKVAVFPVPDWDLLGKQTRGTYNWGPQAPVPIHTTPPERSEGWEYWAASSKQLPPPPQTDQRLNCDPNCKGVGLSLVSPLLNHRGRGQWLWFLHQGDGAAKSVMPAGAQVAEKEGSPFCKYHSGPKPSSNFSFLFFLFGKWVFKNYTNWEYRY